MEISHTKAVIRQGIVGSEQLLERVNQDIKRGRDMTGPVYGKGGSSV